MKVFVQVDPHVEYTIRFCDELGLNFILKLEYKKLFCIAFTGREQAIYGSTT